MLTIPSHNKLLLPKLFPWLQMILVSIFSCAVSIGTIELIGYEAFKVPNADGSMWPAILSITFFLGSMILWIVVLVVVLMHAFIETTRKKILADIGAAYLSTVLAFSGAYYMLGSIADHAHFVRERVTLEYRPEAYKENSYTNNERGFKGISTSMFKGIESRVLSMDVRYGATPTPEQLWEAAHSRGAGIPEFAPENRIFYFLDCIYLSVATITTLGYGDVTPNIWYTKIAAILESLLGIALAAVALGLFFNGEESKRKT